LPDRGSILLVRNRRKKKRGKRQAFSWIQKYEEARMKRLMVVLIAFFLAAAAYAEVTDVVLKAFMNKTVVVVEADGTEVKGQLASFDASTAVVIRADGEVVEIARADMRSVRGEGGGAKAPAEGSRASAGDKPVAPDLEAIKERSDAERQIAFNEELQLFSDPLIYALRMGESGRFFPVAQWEPVLRQAPPAYQLYQKFSRRTTTSMVFQISGLVVLIPGMVMSFLGPYIPGIICDLVSLTLSLTALIARPSKNDFLRIADAYNGYLKESLNLSLSGQDDTPMMAMAPFPGQAPTGASFEIRLVSLRL
jgi:small nuclear ribonucleoprotein (snRNP)-like protein